MKRWVTRAGRRNFSRRIRPSTTRWAGFCTGKGSVTSAVRYLQAAVSGSGNARQKYHLAIAYAAVGDRRRGIQIFEQALRQEPALREASLARSVLFRILKRVTRSM